MVDKQRVDEATGTKTVGHEWDGIEELDTPMPRWWLWTFYACIIWAAVYVVLYPAIPLLDGATKGTLGWSTRQDVADDLARAKKAQKGTLAKIASMDLTDIQADDALRQAAFRGGRSAFKVNCVQCHGSGAEGSTGFANLNDDDWIWGGTLEQIEASIRHGIRYSQDDDTRISDMPAFGADEILTRQQITQTAHYVLSLSDSEHDGEAATAGAPVYADNCAACHGETGQGNQELGAPKLNDSVWLYDGNLETVVSQISKPRQGVMPAWQGRLDDVVIKQLTLYVHGLGGGVASPQ